AMRTYPEIKDAAVKGFDNGRSGVLLAAYFTADEDIDAHDMRSYLEKRLVHYMVPSRFIRLDELPKNANGKLDRSALLKPEDDLTETEYTVPVNDTQRKICDAMAGILGVNRVGITDDFFDLGGDSIGCASLVTELSDLDIETKLIYEHRTPEALAEAIDKREGKSKIDPAEDDKARKKAYPLLPYQLYYVDYTLYSPGKSLLNNPVYICFPKESYTLEEVEAAVRKTTDAYAVFRTVFEFSESGDLMQRYDPDIDISPEIKHMSETEFMDHERAAFVKPFKLIGEPLWRYELIDTESNVIAYFDFHHSIGDGTAFMECFRQIFASLSGKDLSDDLYYLYLKRYNERMKDPKVLEDIEYLNSLYAGEYVKYPEPDLVSRDNVYARIDSESTRSYAEYELAASKMGVSLGNVFVAAGLLALARFSHSSRVLAGWLYNGRDERWKEHIIGLLLSGLSVAVDLTPFGFDADADNGSVDHRDSFDRQGLLNEVKKQSEIGIKYSEYSYAIRKISPAEDERILIVYEHGIGAPDTMPDDVAIHDYYDANTGTSCLYQVLIFEKGSDLPFTLLFNYMDSRYSKEV
ncbi:MAG: hypothetical protein IK123_09360, partial [Lachnospiraceae bacterium]|nr:hypothetical protein [Lachnospiraceae bacterium]